MHQQEIVAGTLVLWRDAERLLQTLPEHSTDRRYAALVAWQMRWIHRELTGTSRVVGEAELREAEQRVVSAKALLDGMANVAPEGRGDPGRLDDLAAVLLPSKVDAGSQPWDRMTELARGTVRLLSATHATIARTRRTLERQNRPAAEDAVDRGRA